MTKVIPLHDIKRAKVLVKELGDLMTVIDRQLSELDKFKKYKPVIEIIAVARTNKIILQAHYNKSMRLLEKK